MHVGVAYVHVCVCVCACSSVSILCVLIFLFMFYFGQHDCLVAETGAQHLHAKKTKTKRGGPST